MSPALTRRTVAAALTLSTAGLACALTAVPAFADPAGSGLVISEVYVNGGSSGASYQNKFVEFYNPSGGAVSLAGDTLQYRAATSTVVPGGSQVFALSGTVAAHGHFLVQLPGNGAGSNPGEPLPAPDASTGGSVNPGAAGGTLYLASSGSGVLPTDPAVIDKIGWGTSNSPETSAPTGNSLTLSYQRSADGTDTDDNAADFHVAAPTPRNAASDGDDSGGDGGDDGGGDDGGPAPQTLTIAAIQGTDTDTSPYAGQSVTTEGVVTATYPAGGLNGFFLQTGGSGGRPADDRTPGASDAVFVFGSDAAGAVTAGQSVRVTGTVQEYQGETEIGSPEVTALPEPLPGVTADVIPWSGLDSDAEKEAHEGELVAPQGDFTVSDNYDANWYGSFVLAAGDTPLRQPTDAARAGTAAARAVVADNAQRAVTLDDGSSWNYSSGANTGRPLPWLTPDNPVSIGARVTFHEPVVLDYRYAAWTFQPTAQVTGDGADVATFADRRAANQRPAAVGGDASLATFNVENYFPTTGAKYVAAGLGTCTYYDDRAGTHITVRNCTGTDGGAGPRGAANDASFARQQAKIVTGINRLGAAIVSLEEVENSVKFGQPRDTALAGLVDALNAAAGSDVWAYAPSPAADKLPPPAQQDVIRTAFIYRSAQVSLVGPGTVLTGDSDPGEPFSIAREPLAQGFTKAGARDADAFVVVANHWKSKGSGTPLYPGDEQDTTPGSDQGAFNATRVREARDTSAFATRVAQGLGTDRIFLLGDFNAYTHEDPMEELYADGYTDLAGDLDPAESTYSYDGLQGSLDHVLANPAAHAMVTGADVWQINAQEAVAYAYSRYNYNATLLFDGGDPFAASDHDPVVAGLHLPSTPAAPAWNASTVYDTGDTVTYHGSTWRALWWTRNQPPGDPYGPWEEIATASDGTAIWTPTRVFTAGDVVLYQGRRYVAQWWTRNQAPGGPYGPWKAAG
ncbi:ExeM/NucH family extracellular endonuclease [Mangrovihabitans endophyticus]|uniref:LTD domain-containing protein n=1 Tax=Mangrovihabitans endophyticus TaxID=1751298 RepID=A0A8J3C057_9ACTN|nr:ExeM/NucH family extracellular endonuclease [Mangrovihabitans endophyticus]GGK91687.1 hypothetical protein GCM10012284_26980 [Mangrovihabitans endophyticus]